MPIAWNPPKKSRGQCSDACVPDILANTCPPTREEVLQLANPRKPCFFCQPFLVRRHLLCRDVTFYTSSKSSLESSRASLSPCASAYFRMYIVSREVKVIVVGKGNLFFLRRSVGRRHRAGLSRLRLSFLGAFLCLAHPRRTHAPVRLARATTNATERLAVKSWFKCVLQGTAVVMTLVVSCRAHIGERLYSYTTQAVVFQTDAQGRHRERRAFVEREMERVCGQIPGTAFSASVAKLAPCFGRLASNSQ